MRPRRSLSAVLVVLVVAGTAWWLLRGEPTITAGCTATAGKNSYLIDPEQAANATTIAAEARRQGMPNHAVSVGLAAALQESKLRNLNYGDRDSLGLFQQRPSQGWGTPEQLLDTQYASAAFFRGLRHVKGWQSMPIYVAAQRVQRSAAAIAYAKWDTESRTLARGFTGETPAGFTCRYPPVPKSTSTTAAALQADAADALGAEAFGPDTTPAHGWLVASWLISRAPSYGVNRVNFDGWTWTPSAQGWRRDTTTRPAGVSYSLRPAAE